MTTCDKYFRELRADEMRAESQRSEPLIGEEDYIFYKILLSPGGFLHNFRCSSGCSSWGSVVGCNKKIKDEEKLWNKAVLSADTPEGLLNAVFFSNGMNFILRNGEEYRDLKSISPDGRVRYTYTENTSKNRSGGFNQLDVPHKVVHQYEDPRAGPRCHVFLLDLYLSKIPDRAKDQDIFYMRPLPSVPLGESLPWFTCAPVGKNTLIQMTKKMCGEADIDGNKTNHSLMAYAMSKLFQE